MIRRPPRSTQSRSSAASDVYKRQLRDSQLQQNEKYGGVQNARVDVDACVHILQSADREDRILPKNEQNPNPGKIYPPLSFSNCCNSAESVLKTGTGAVNNHLPLIHSTDYKQLDIPEPHISCFSCGKKGSWYVEKLTAKRRTRPKDKQAARRVCRHEKLTSATWRTILRYQGE